ncbi:MAG: hypothetical protein U0998_05090 [Moraxellaceae bacterium]|nr:hypothetical protein [Moraxellaceae bacterium]
MSLLKAWSCWQPSTAPFLLDADIPAFEKHLKPKNLQVTLESWEAARDSNDFCSPIDSRFHMGLLPQPFMGNVSNAKVYVLLLNPGLGPHDYYAEYQVTAYREALMRNLHQSFRSDDLPFLFLDPKYAWHGGFTWWQGKLAQVIQSLSQSRKCSFAEAQRYISLNLASIELVPYHSKSFKAPSRFIEDLESAKLARHFVNHHVLPRVRNKEAIVIVTRRVNEWGLTERDGVILYDKNQARGAHLSLASKGGRAILEFLS